MTTRQYQTEAKHNIYDAWNGGASNVLLRMPTGAGKTFVFSEILQEHKGAAVAIAHRQELVGQISLSLASMGVFHNIIASRDTVKFLASYHSRELGQSFFHPQAPIAVAGVDTLLRRDLGQWAHQVTLWVQDEAHHVLKKNKWGKAANLFPNARGLGVTATPGRADGQGLGRHSDGLFDVMVESLEMRELIEMGYLTDYRVFAPPSDMDLSDVALSNKTGDYNPNQLRNASHKSHIVGDVVDQYIRIAAGKLGLTFAVDVETATEIAERYRHFGISSEVISAKTPNHLRVELLARFRRREILNLVNVDLFGEGFDVPAVEVVSKARPTQSFPLYAQQFGRGLRPMDDKFKAFIIDHVGNVIRHGLPDAPHEWSLDARERGKRGKRDETVIPVTACTRCMSIYERQLVNCPFCGHKPEPAGRARPEQVDGDLFELSSEALAEMRGQTVAMQQTADEQLAVWCDGKPPTKQQYMMHAVLKKKQNAVHDLTNIINHWGAFYEANGNSRQEAYRRFFHRFGMDVLTAQTLGKKDAEKLTIKIQDDFR